MTLRRCTVEHPFGTIKAWMGAPHFLSCRLKNVRTEMARNVLAFDIKRMIALVGIRRLMETIPGQATTLARCKGSFAKPPSRLRSEILAAMVVLRTKCAFSALAPMAAFKICSKSVL